VGADDRADLGDEERLGAHHLTAALDQPLSALRVPYVLDDPGVVPGTRELVRVLDEPFEHPLAGPHPFDRGDLVFEGEDRLDLQRRTHPGARRADSPALAQVLERVDRKPHPQPLAGRGDPVDDLLGRLPGIDRGCGRQDQHPHPTATRAAVDDVNAFTATTLVDQLLPRLQRRLVGAGDPSGEVDRDDPLTRIQKRPVDLDEVADRRLRGRRPAVARSEALEERCVIADLVLAALLAAERDVETDLLDAAIGDDALGKVGRRVADDRGIRRGAHREPL
jgi:hypothetical protein